MRLSSLMSVKWGTYGGGDYKESQGVVLQLQDSVGTSKPTSPVDCNISVAPQGPARQRCHVTLW